MSNFKAGQKVYVVLTTPHPFGGDPISTSEPARVLSVTRGAVLLDNGPGNDPSGPYFDATGERVLPLPGCQMRIQHEKD